MKNKPSLFLPSCLGTFCLALAFFASPGRTQEKTVPEYVPKLAQIVRLTLGETTIATALAVLSQQTGVRIDASDYLRERIMVIQMEGITGRTALGAIAALNDLKWREIGPNHILVERPAPKQPEKVTQVPGLLPKAMPKDMRDCLLVGMPQKQAWQFADTSAFKRKSDYEFSLFIHSRISELIQEQKRLFEAALPPKLSLGAKLPFRTMNPAQQSELLTILFFEEINRLQFSFMHGDLAPYQKDVMQAALHLHKTDGILEIGTVTHEGTMETYSFFGAPVAPASGLGQNQSSIKP